MFIGQSNTDNICIQTRGHIDSFFIDASYASSEATLQMVAGTYNSTDVSRVGYLPPDDIYPPRSTAPLGFALGDYYFANWGYHWIVPPPDNRYLPYSVIYFGEPLYGIGHGLARGQLPYPVEDQVWVTHNSFTLMQVYYEAILAQDNRLGTAFGQIQFGLEQVDILQVPRY